MKTVINPYWLVLIALFCFASCKKSNNEEDYPHFSDVYNNIIYPKCLKCHDTPNTNTLDLRTKKIAYENLVDKSTTCTNTNYIGLAGKPTLFVDSSMVGSINYSDNQLSDYHYLYRLLYDKSQACGSQHSSVTEEQMKLTTDELGKIKTWLSNTKNNLE